jgi:hypothetical protein
MTPRARMMFGSVAVAACALGIWHGATYGALRPHRPAVDQAVIRTGTDPSTYASTSANPNAVTVPVRNDSPFAVTVIKLWLNDAPKLGWDRRNAVIQPGQTVDMVLRGPADCVVTGTGDANAKPVDVSLRVVTVDGKPHRIDLFLLGAVQEDAVDCGGQLAQSYPEIQGVA